MGKYGFERFLNTRSASCGSLRADGEHLAFLTDITQTAQLWMLDKPMSWPEQLTFYNDRLMFASFGPGGQVAFGKDAGGDEDQLIFLIDAEGGLAAQASLAQAKHLWGGWSPDGRRIAWSHNGRNGRDFDIYIYDLETRSESLVFEGEGYNYVAAWLADGKRVIAGKAESNANNDLWLLELASGERVHLTARQGDAYYGSVAPTPDGLGCFVISNVGRDFANLAVIDFASAQCTFVDEHDWDREEVALSCDGRYLAMLTNEEGYSVIEVRDLVTGSVQQIEGIARGVASGLAFAHESERFAVTLSGPSDTMDVWTVDAASGQALRWTRSSMAGIVRETLIEPELVRFESFDGLLIPAFFYKPTTPGPYKVIIDIHGGPEGQRRPQFAAVFQYLVEQGFAVLSPNVRGSSGYGKHFMGLDDVELRMDSVKDIAAARSWLIEWADADPNRIGLMGGSYGGFMVLSAMVTYPELWAAGVDVVGIASLVTFLENTASYRRALREQEYGSLEHDREFLHSISPLTWIDNISAPLMVVHGRNDPRVPVSEADQVARAVRAKGHEVDLVIYEDEGHGIAKRSNRLDAYPKIAAFFARHLA
ncbi:MAG: S9 family peptidase [Bradymonadaceae bacterium]|nr:S9 family peptidase [Lujinxingiaceae bacterium]